MLSPAQLLINSNGLFSATPLQPLLQKFAIGRWRSSVIDEVYDDIIHLIRIRLNVA